MPGDRQVRVQREPASAARSLPAPRRRCPRGVSPSWISRAVRCQPAPSSAVFTIPGSRPSARRRGGPPPPAVTPSSVIPYRCPTRSGVAERNLQDDRGSSCSPWSASGRGDSLGTATTHQTVYVTGLTAADPHQVGDRLQYRPAARDPPGKRIARGIPRLGAFPRCAGQTNRVHRDGPARPAHRSQWESAAR